MTVSKNEKARILEAYFEKAITKEEMEVLLIEGIVIPPIPWVISLESEQLKDNRKRELILKVFGLQCRKVEWLESE